MDIKYRIRPKFIFRDVEEEGVVLLPESDPLYALSESAKLVWKEMTANDNSITYSRIIDVLSEHYEGDDNEIKEDAKLFILKMIENQLFEVVDT